MSTLNCQIVINGRQVFIPLEMTKDGETYFAVLPFLDKEGKSQKIQLDESRLEAPSGIQKAWNYKGLLLEIRSPPK